MTRYSSRTDFVACTSAVQAEDTTGGATGTCDGFCYGFGSSAAPELEYFFCTHDRLPDTPAQQPNEVSLCCQTQSCPLWPWCSPVGGEGKERATCVTGVKWCLLWKGVEAAVILLAFLSGTTMASHPSESDVRTDGINVIPLIGCYVYEGV